MDTKFKKFTLLGGDLIVLYLSLYITLLLRYFAYPSASLWQKHFWPFTAIFGVWLLIFYISNLYSLHAAVNDSRSFASLIKAVMIAGALSALFFYLNPAINIAPKRNLIIYLAVFSIIFMLWRRTFNWLLKAHLPKEKIAFVGYNGQVRELIEKFKQEPHLGFSVGLIVNEAHTDAVSDIPVLTRLDELRPTVEKNKITTIVLAADPNQSPKIRTALFGCLPHKINFISLPNFYEKVTGKVPIEAINQMWFLENLSEGNKNFFDFLKRGYDFLFAILLLIATLPFWPIIGLLIKLDSPGTIFYKQRRIGLNYKPFTIIKFRTMKVADNDQTPARSNDDRITRLGKFFRATRIDEIPQLLNIIFGDMSFVGPRPERPELVSELEKQIPFYKERTLVKPGLTGWDQISGEYHSPSREDTLKKLQYDLFYIKNRSVYLDLSTILKTIAIVLSRAGV